MDIYEYALQRESDSEAYYRETAATCPDGGLKNILLRLADSEVRHQQVIRKMREKTGAHIAADPFLADVKGLFAQLRDRGARPSPGAPQEEMYRKAQSFEKESWDMYLKAAEEARTDAAKAVLLRLAAQERVHYQVLGTLIDLVSRPLPGNWLENAEWYHITDY